MKVLAVLIVFSGLLPQLAGADQHNGLSSSTVLVFQMNRRHTGINFQCSGSLVAHDLVLTAAHCLFPSGKGNKNRIRAKNIMIYFGDLNFGEKFDPKLIVYATEVATHPNYSGKFSREEMPNLKDLALIKFKKRFPGSNFPVSVLPSSTSLNSGFWVLVAGYGKGYEGQQHQNLIFHSYEGYSITDVGSNYSLVTLGGIPQLGSKEGDSGGPSFLFSDGAFKQWGVFSAYDPNAGLAFYVDLRKEKVWLNETAKRWGSIFVVE